MNKLTRIGFGLLGVGIYFSLTRFVEMPVEYAFLFAYLVIDGLVIRYKLKNRPPANGQQLYVNEGDTIIFTFPVLDYEVHDITPNIERIKHWQARLKEDNNPMGHVQMLVLEDGCKPVVIRQGTKSEQ